jgi:hypothetical protein
MGECTAEFARLPPPSLGGDATDEDGEIKLRIATCRTALNGILACEGGEPTEASPPS